MGAFLGIAAMHWRIHPLRNMSEVDIECNQCKDDQSTQRDCLCYTTTFLGTYFGGPISFG
jgi:hypothetical protein